MCIIKSDVPAVSSVKFTQNTVKAAPLLKGRQSLESSGYMLQALVINSGNANAGTGEQGLRDVDTTLDHLSEKLEIPKKYLLMSSTGIIGEYLNMDMIKKGINAIVPRLSKAGGQACAKAILTTDTRAKNFGVRLEIHGKTVTFAGITKGAGMIAPNMATTLSFITTDLAIGQPTLDKIFTQAVNQSFNMITVDGHMSTNDTALIMANGMAENPEIQEGSPEYESILKAVSYLMTEMAMAVVKDGEGATKFVKVIVARADGFENAKKMAFGVANSALVKTAIFGNDPNWGRILSAVGMVNIPFDPGKVSISINHNNVLDNGTPVTGNKDAKALMTADTVEILIEINSGQDKAVVYTCDLSYDYVKINADYHT